MEETQARICPHCRQIIVFKDGAPTDLDYTVTMVTAQEKMFLSNASPPLQTTLVQKSKEQQPTVG